MISRNYFSESLMYLKTLLSYKQNPNDASQQLRSHFFRPYANRSAFVCGIFYPIDALFEHTIPNLILTTYLIGQSIFHAFSCLGSLLLLQGDSFLSESQNTVNALFSATVVFALAMLSPLLEAARFFTRWGATVASNLPTHFDQEHNTQKQPTSLSLSF